MQPRGEAQDPSSSLASQRTYLCSPFSASCRGCPHRPCSGSPRVLAWPAWRTALVLGAHPARLHQQSQPPPLLASLGAGLCLRLKSAPPATCTPSLSTTSPSCNPMPRGHPAASPLTPVIIWLQRRNSRGTQRGPGFQTPAPLMVGGGAWSPGLWQEQR